MSTAAELYQTWLDRMAEAIWWREWDVVSGAMIYPHKMETKDGEIAFHNPDDMVEAATDFREYLGRIGANAYLRVCNSADFADEMQTIRGVHTTYILRGGSYLVPPFSNQMTLTHVDGLWLGAGIRAAVSNHLCSILSPNQLRRKQLAEGHDIIKEG
ncbi:MAG: hypothetical protein AAGC82_11985 [Pseudomonadota bacterium]